MARINLTQTFALLSLALLLNLLSGSLTKITLAKETDNIHRQGFPGRRVGGGTRRGGCADAQKPLTALIPESNLWVTTAAYPSFFFYVPQSANSQVVEFVLRDENDNQVYEENMSLSGQAGIVSVSLPQSRSLPPLAMNQNYHWYFSIVCDPQNRSNDLVVEGWIQRVEITATLARELEGATQSEQVALYLNAGIWHDAMATLAQMRRTSSNDLVVVADWTKLLHSVGLDAIATEPLTDLELANSQHNLSPTVD